jgi:trigger factor
LNMAVTVETLEKLERKITLAVPRNVITDEIDTRLKRLQRSVKMDGFRPGKVPMNVVAQRYGYSVQYEVINDKVGQAFFEAANEAKLRVAGQPRISENEGSKAEDAELKFDAIFEVYPEVTIKDLSGVEIEKITTEVTDAAIDKTLEILRKQRVTFSQRAKDHAAVEGDKVQIDFAGTLDGEAFAGGTATDFEFTLGEGQMLKEFEGAVTGMKTGESKTFPLTFPEDYHGKDVAGKQADFLVTVKRLQAQNLPEVNEAFAKSLGIADATIAGLRADIKKNLEREVKFRLIARNKNAVMDALVGNAELELPKASVQSELERLKQQAVEDLKRRGMKDANISIIPDDVFVPQAERRVRLGLVVAELVRANTLHAKEDQIKSHVDELAASYEKPADVVRWYFGDNQRLAEVEAVIIENNVTEFVLAKAKVSEKSIAFDDLMGQT